MRAIIEQDRHTNRAVSSRRKPQYAATRKNYFPDTLFWQGNIQFFKRNLNILTSFGGKARVNKSWPLLYKRAELDSRLTKLFIKYNKIKIDISHFFLQLHFKLLPSGGKAEMNYILYPLLAGEAVPLPRPRLTSVRLSTHPQDDDVTETLDRLLITSITGGQTNKRAKF